MKINKKRLVTFKNTQKFKKFLMTPSSRISFKLKNMLNFYLQVTVTMWNPFLYFKNCLKTVIKNNDT